MSWIVSHYSIAGWRIDQELHWLFLFAWKTDIWIFSDSKTINRCLTDFSTHESFFLSPYLNFNIDLTNKIKFRKNIMIFSIKKMRLLRITQAYHHLMLFSSSYFFSQKYLSIFRTKSTDITGVPERMATFCFKIISLSFFLKNRLSIVYFH